MIPWDEEDWDRAVFIAGHCGSLSEAQWRQILAERGIDLNAQTLSKLVEFRGGVIEGLRANIEAERNQPTRAEIAKEVEARLGSIWEDWRLFSAVSWEATLTETIGVFC